MSTEIAKPLLKSGALFIWEVARCLLLGIAINTLIFIGSYVVLGSGLATANHNVSALIWLYLLRIVSLVLYAFAGHQRGINRVLATLTHAHGGLLFDQTLGRFAEAVEARQSGTMTTLVKTPEKLAAAFKTYLQDTAVMPRLIKRVALHYVTRLSLSATRGIPADVVSEDQFHPQAFKKWTIEKMQDCFVTSWKNFGIVSVLQILAAGTVYWLA